MSGHIEDDKKAADRREAIGALSRIDGATVLRSLAIPTEGRLLDLGLELGQATAHHPAFVRFTLAFTQTPEGTGAMSPFQFSAEAISGALHVGTHIDSLIHIQKDGRIFGGHLARDSRNDRGWTRYGAETIRPILGRAVFLDIPKLKGLSRLPDRYEITVEDIEEELARIDRSVLPGDIVLVRTGKMQDVDDEVAFHAAEPGVGREAALWLYGAGMAVLGTDTSGTEPMPFVDPTRTAHVAMLVESGVHLIENLYLEEVSRLGRSQGLFIALPLKITGATGSWLRPVLVV
jgi:kynurenine formamidase